VEVEPRESVEDIVVVAAVVVVVVVVVVLAVEAEFWWSIDAKVVLLRLPLLLPVLVQRAAVESFQAPLSVAVDQAAAVDPSVAVAFWWSIVTPSHPSNRRPEMEQPMDEREEDERDLVLEQLVQRVPIIVSKELILETVNTLVVVVIVIYRFTLTCPVEAEKT
jgi:hypothetical protein